MWNFFFHGSRKKNILGVGVILVSPSLEKFYFSYRLQFSCTNNIAEYGALIQGHEFAQKRGIKSLKVVGDSELVVNQVRSQNITKNNLLKSYKHRVWDLLEGSQAFNIQSIPRRDNKCVERLAAIGSHYDVPDHVEDKREQHIRLVVRPIVLDNHANW